MRNKLLHIDNDWEFESSAKFRRASMQGEATEPLSLKKEFLKRGGGNGGSPTNFDHMLKDNRTLVPIVRMAKQPIVRIRDR